MAEPLVTIILPIRNEAHYIARCLHGVLTQTYPRDKIEVSAVDGMSDDGTREIVAAFAREDPRLQLMDNPERITPAALNRGLRQAHGEVVIRVDGHAVIAPDYVRRCVDVLSQVDADCVGGSIRTVGETWMSRVIALAQSSPFGVGNAAFRYANRAQYVDTLAFGAYRRRVFERIGLFDEELVRNQDDEFNLRLTQANGKIWLDPAIRSDYFSRATLGTLWKQYFAYGFWKVRVIQKRGRLASWRHLAPAAFVSVLLGSLLLALILRLPAIGLVVLLPYLLAAATASLWLGARRGWGYVSVLPLAFGALHFAYGLGFLTGLLRFGFSSAGRRLNPMRPKTEVDRVRSRAKLEKLP